MARKRPLTSMWDHPRRFELGVELGVFLAGNPNRRYPHMALKELEVKYAAIRSRAYKLTDGGGLHLFVQPNGSKLWRMKYRFAGKEKLLSFGKYPDVPLAAARTKRDEARACLAEGRDPGVVQAEEQQAAERIRATDMPGAGSASIDAAQGAARGG
ncbi:MAG: integrase [Novosphingobium lindaniclasticum]|nr:integrase [Novosphingobium lindaniclasticum]